MDDLDAHRVGRAEIWIWTVHVVVDGSLAPEARVVAAKEVKGFIVRGNESLTAGHVIYECEVEQRQVQ